jgi:hypothetical protein
MREPKLKWSLHILDEVQYCAKTNILTLLFADGQKAEFGNANEIESYDYQVKATFLVCQYQRDFAPNKWWLGGVCQVELVDDKGRPFGFSKITNASHTQYDKPFKLPEDHDEIGDFLFK